MSNTFNLSVFNGKWELKENNTWVLYEQSEYEYQEERNPLYQMVFVSNIFNKKDDDGQNYGQGWVVRSYTKPHEQYFAIKTSGLPWASDGQIIYSDWLTNIPANSTKNVQITELLDIVFSSEMKMVSSYEEDNYYYQLQCAQGASIDVQLASLSSDSNDSAMTVQLNKQLPEGCSIIVENNIAYLRGVVNSDFHTYVTLKYNEIRKTFHIYCYIPFTLQTLENTSKLQWEEYEGSYYNEYYYCIIDQNNTGIIKEENWIPYSLTDSLIIEPTQKLCLKGDRRNSGNIHFKTENGRLKLSGLLESLYGYKNGWWQLDYDYSSDNSYRFEGLFQNCKNIVDASELKMESEWLSNDCYYRNMFKGCISLMFPPQLPSVSLTSSCYESMFEDCTSLTEAPQLPASMSYYAQYVYCNMFKGCTSLTTPPELPSESLSQGCYASMFEGCTSLLTIPQLNAYYSSIDCYHSMFKGCTSLKEVNLIPDNGDEYYYDYYSFSTSCYESMFEGCTSLTTVSQLPQHPQDDYQSWLSKNCFKAMFKDCTSLIKTPSLPDLLLVESCYESMFEGCTSLTKAPELPATDLAKSCYKSMFKNCTSLVSVSSLNAVELRDNCYESMFEGCSNLQNVKVSFISWVLENGNIPTTNWLKDVSTKGQFYKYKALSNTRGDSAIPQNWKVINLDKVIQDVIVIQGLPDVYVDDKIYMNEVFGQIKYLRQDIADNIIISDLPDTNISTKDKFYIDNSEGNIDISE